MNIGELKNKSDLSYNIAVAKRNALEKANSRMIVVYNEHIFRADPETINLVNVLKENNSNFFVLDTNNNPVEITNPEEFLKTLIERNQESLSSYHQMAKTFEQRGD
tara:strand:+ start:424 stop:741 length:318 start_codon:yes stop_codon:yes gene_type:complete